MKKIAIYIPTLDSGGAEKQAVLLASMLAIDHEVHLITLNTTNRYSLHNLKILENSSVIQHSIPHNVFRNIKQLIGILKENRIEVLFNYLTLPNLLGSYAGKKAHIPKIYNGIRNSELPLWKLIPERYAHNHWCTRTIFNCHSGAKNLSKKGFRADLCEVIPNCFVNIHSHITRQEKEIKDIITVGRFVKQKDYLTAIKAISKLYTLRQDFMFHIVGYGKLEKDIRGWIQKYGLEQKTIFHIKPANVYELLKNADIYLSTSIFEGTSNSIMEAMNFSLPIVCTLAGDNDHLVYNKENGYTHPIGSNNEIAISLNKLLDSLSLRNSYGKSSNQILRDHFSSKIFYERYLKLI